MNKIEISNNSGDILFSYECEYNNIKITLEKALKEGADLRDANLRGADLCGADLCDNGKRGQEYPPKTDVYQHF